MIFSARISGVYRFKLSLGDLMKFFKYLSIPIVLMCFVLCFSGYKAWKETKIQNDLVEYSLKGNSAAIAILQKYEKPWKLDERLVYEAIAGNEGAIKALGVQSK